MAVGVVDLDGILSGVLRFLRIVFDSGMVLRGVVGSAEVQTAVCPFENYLLQRSSILLKRVLCATGGFEYTIRGGERSYSSRSLALTLRCFGRAWLSLIIILEIDQRWSSKDLKISNTCYLFLPYLHVVLVILSLPADIRLFRAWSSYMTMLRIGCAWMFIVASIHQILL